jgi:hypothetical protein
VLLSPISTACALIATAYALMVASREATLNGREGNRPSALNKAARFVVVLGQ